MRYINTSCVEPSRNNNHLDFSLRKLLRIYGFIIFFLNLRIATVFVKKKQLKHVGCIKGNKNKTILCQNIKIIAKRELMNY